MLKKFFLISLISYSSSVIAQEAIPLPPMPDLKQQESIDKIKSVQPEIKEELPVKPQQKKENKALKKIPIKIGLSKTEDEIYLSLASTICIFINEKEDTACRIKQFNDPIEAMNGMLSGDVDIVMTNSLLGKYTSDGNLPFDKNMQVKKVRFIASFFDEKLAILANREADVRNLDDLKKISVNIGKNFTKQRMFFNELIRLKQWNISDFSKSAELDNSEEVKAICDKSIDGLIIVGEDMNRYMKDATRLCEVESINLTSDELNLFNNDPGFLQAKISGGTYVGMPKDINTVATKAILLTTSDISSSQIENLLNIIKNNLQKVKLLHNSLKDLTLKSMVWEGNIAPQHDGVVNFIDKNNLKEGN